MFFRSAQVTLCGSQNLSFQNQAKIPAILLCPLLSCLPRPAKLSAAQGAQRCARGWPESVPPAPPPPLRPLLSKARGEPRSLLPLAALGKGAASPVTWQPGPHALIGSSSRQAEWHTRPARPHPEGRAQPLRPRRGGTTLESAARPWTQCVLAQCLEQRRGTGPLHPLQLQACPHMLRTPVSAPLEFQGSLSASRSPIDRKKAGRGQCYLQKHPALTENDKRRSSGRKAQRRKK